MKIKVRVKTGAKEGRVEKIGEGEYSVRVKARPVEGKANDAVIEALAKYFGIAKSRVALVTGRTSKQKLFEIL